MSYFIGVIFLLVLGLILAYTLPTAALVWFAAALILSALTVQISTRLVTHKEIAFLTALKALVISALMMAAAGFLGMKLLSAVSPALLILAPVLAFGAQLLAFSVILEVTMAASLLISICVSVIFWIIGAALGLSMTAAFKFLH